MQPEVHVYPAIVLVIVIWTVLHVFAGSIMQLYCMARRLAGRMTHRYDADMWNVALFWHFVALTTTLTALVTAGFPLVSR